MNEFYNMINELSGGKYKDLRFPRITMGAKATVAVVCKKTDRAFTEANRAELVALSEKVCEFHIPVALEISDETPSTVAIRKALVAFTDKFGYVASASRTLTVEAEPRLCVRLEMHTSMYELAKNDYIPRLKEFLLNSYAEEIALDVRVREYSDDAVLRPSAPAAVHRAEYAIKNAVPIIGTLKPEKAQSISSLTASAYNVTACGIMVMPISFMSKGGRVYERFLLYDGDATLQCRFSPSGVSLARPELINKPVCVLGNVEYESARNEATMSVREISYCEADGLAEIPAKPEPPSYAVVRPQAYEVLVQSSMFDGDLSLPPSLVGDFVVFDFETTGLSVLYDKPTELGAVKISDGRLVESFSTLIDPRREIPPAVVEKTGITNEMVKGQPLFEDILPDFYKFTYGCSVVCHNVPFDFPFLIRGGNACGWAFGDRRTFDTMALAPRAIPGISKLTLDRVLEELGLTNDSAHRAASDAAATARAFIEMQKILARNK